MQKGPTLADSTGCRRIRKLQERCQHINEQIAELQAKKELMEYEILCRSPRLFAFRLQYYVFITPSPKDTLDIDESGEYRGMGIAVDESPERAIMQALFNILKTRFEHGYVTVELWVDIKEGSAPNPRPWETVWRLP
jgi:hypothetical protein